METDHKNQNYNMHCESFIEFIELFLRVDNNRIKTLRLKHTYLPLAHHQIFLKAIKDNMVI